MAKKLKKIKDKAWKEFSKYIRLRDSDENGNCKCCTCGVIKPWKEMQGGHFISGRNNAVLFSENGVHAQCYSCNVPRHGNTVKYFLFMEERYGRDEVDRQISESNKTVKYTHADYQEIYEKYKELAEEME